MSTRNTPARSTRRGVKSAAKSAATDTDGRTTLNEKSLELDKVPEVKKLDFEESKTDESPTVKVTKRPSPSSLNKRPVAQGSSSSEDNIQLPDNQEKEQVLLLLFFCFFEFTVVWYLEVVVHQIACCLVSSQGAPNFWGARCSSVVRAFAHGAMGHWIDPSWGGPIELFLVPASAPQLV